MAVKCEINAVKTIALCDSGSSCNILALQDVEKLNLIVESNVRKSLMLADGSVVKTDREIKEVEVILNEAVVVTDFQVLGPMSNTLKPILGVPFLKASEATLQFNANGVTLASKVNLPLPPAVETGALLKEQDQVKKVIEPPTLAEGETKTESIDVKQDSIKQKHELSTAVESMRKTDLKTSIYPNKVFKTVKQVAWADLSPAAGEERMPLDEKDRHAAAELVGVVIPPWRSPSVDLKRKELHLRKVQNFALRREKRLRYAWLEIFSCASGVRLGRGLSAEINANLPALCFASGKPAKKRTYWGRSN
ncbi:hypothetical protein KSP39_PZI006668 [Platanthera zijinensis]|uniref:Aspartic peptidase DDI1-type domain-containing protein n=1 Tax=Platanthera zijinensis TaxID=2320716 RepID=A0AAP0G9I6_9ASPA